MDIRLLGDVELTIGGVMVAPERNGERCVLAALALEAGRPVLIGLLIEHIWGDHAPPKADETVRTYARSVRRLIERAGGSAESLRNRRPGGYALEVEPHAVDYRRFVDLTSAARVRARDGDRQPAVEAFEEALRLWHGAALANITGDWAGSLRDRMERQRLNATYEVLGLHLRAGRAAAMVSRATELASADPTDRTVALALRCLALSGQRTLIPAFMTRMVDRMREAGDRPSAQVIALARELIEAGTGEGRAGASGGERRLSAGPVTLTATNAVNVYQAAGDQFIIES